MRKTNCYLALLLLAAACSSSPGEGGDGGAADLSRPGDLAGVDFAGADLAGADFAGLDFAGADLATNPVVGASVLQHHLHPSRDGLYTDAAFSKVAAAGMHIDPSLSATYTGQAYAQPLFLDGGAGGRDLLFVVTEQNQVSAFDAATGALVWRKDKALIGNPAAAGDLPCGNLLPNQGITGTPVIDLPSRTLFFGAMVETGTTFQQMIWALSIDDGSPRPGFPIDVAAAFVSDAFDASVQGQRAALLIVNNVVYVPYGGMYGDCGSYFGWVVGVPIANPAGIKGWKTIAPKAGVWAPGGLASDGTSVFGATGNSPGGTPFGQQESIVRLASGPVFSGNAADIFTPSDWQTLDNGDIDIGGSGPILVDRGALHLVVALGKNGKAYLLDRANLGGTGGQLAVASVAAGVIINAAAAYSTASGTYVTFKAPCLAGGGDLASFKIGAGSPPTIDLAGGWCASQNGAGSPMVTTTDGHSNAIVWGVGTESGGGGGDARLHGFDGDTGAVVFAGGGATDKMSTVRRFSTPIAAKGRIFVAADGQLYAFKP